MWRERDGEGGWQQQRRTAGAGAPSIDGLGGPVDRFTGLVDGFSFFCLFD